MNSDKAPRLDSELLKVVSDQTSIIEKLSETVQDLSTKIASQEAQLEQIRLSVGIPMQQEYFEKVSSNQFGYLETVEYVADHRMSLARFGDGELNLAAFPYRNIGFQKGSPELARALREVLRGHHANTLVALPGLAEGRYWTTMFARNWAALSSVIPPNRIWGISPVTRASAFKYHRGAIVEAWRKCWDRREVTVVTGEGSRFEPIDPLFSNVASIEYIYGPARNAFEALPRLTAQILSAPRDLVLISLGPAATVLAAKLSDAGVQALDIGHISNSFAEAFEGGVAPELLPHGKS